MAAERKRVPRVVELITLCVSIKRDEWVRGDWKVDTLQSLKCTPHVRRRKWLHIYPCTLHCASVRMFVSTTVELTTSIKITTSQVLDWNSRSESPEAITRRGFRAFQYNNASLSFGIYSAKEERVFQQERNLKAPKKILFHCYSNSLKQSFCKKDGNERW